MPITEKIGFLGGGAMAEALLAGIINSGLLPPGKLYVSDLQPERLAHLKNKLGINIVKGNTELVQQVDIVVLAVKPFVLSDILEDVGESVTSEQLVISIAAGISTPYIEKYLKQGVPVIRVMPNTPCLLGEGALAVAGGKNSLPEHHEKVEEICSSVGTVVLVKENLMDAVTGVSGSGPAYMYLVAEAMADAGVRMGLPRDIALKLGAKTMLGAAKMILETGEHPARLKDMVTTPGGTTIEGLFALEDAGVRAAFARAVEAACNRSGELSGN
ncbi:MAG: pyrroline-5-carboxylate reductase [Firmicutes bacterium]|nr:pyrroline-5-carboxylate reductase [Bacillota bacterium]